MEKKFQGKSLKKIFSAFAFLMLLFNSQNNKITIIKNIETFNKILVQKYEARDVRILRKPERSIIKNKIFRVVRSLH